MVTVIPKKPYRSLSPWMLFFSSSLDVLAGERGLGDRWAALEAVGGSTTGVWEAEAEPAFRDVRAAIIYLKILKQKW